MSDSTPSLPVIQPDWPAPPGIRALTTTRAGGSSTGQYASLNLAQHVGDEPTSVAINRRILRDSLRLPAEPCWLTQVHGRDIVPAQAASGPAVADGSIARQTGIVCAVLTADCLPILLCDDAGSCVAALHAGWRGLLQGIIGRGVAAFGCDPARILAWLGPAIGAASYEVKADLYDRFVAADSDFARFFTFHDTCCTLDLGAVCTRELLANGVRSIYHANRCTLREPATFFSHRREGVTGRMASLIWRCD